jgi:signal transduction histidine kinase
MDLSRSLLNLGNSYQSSDFPDSALSCYKEALLISKKISYQQGQIANLLGIGNIFFHRYNADMMKPYFEEALTLAKQSGDQQAASIALRGMAFYYLLKKELDKAKKFCVASLQMADSAGTKYDKYESMHALSSILYAQGNIIDAERVKDQMNELENEIRGDELQQKTILIEKKFETGKKEAQIKLQQAQLQQKNTLNYLLGGTAFSAILIGFFGYRNYQHRQKLQQAKIDELETEKQLTVTEAVLKGEEQERTRLAKDLHDGLGGMLSGIKHSLSNIKENLIVTPDNMQAFERSIDMLDGSIREMRRVAHNMMPEILLKYGLDTALKEFCAEVDLSGALHVQYQSIGLANSTIDQTISVTIYRVVQELVNNVIKHAAAKNVLVQVHLSEQLMALTVEDDGKGFDVNALQQSPGIGWSNIKNRIEFLKGRLDVQSDKDSGTSVWIEVKV